MILLCYERKSVKIEQRKQVGTITDKTYLWIEDRKEKASYIFGENFMKQLFPDVIVESKKNNSELVKAVRTLQDTENRYIIVFDNSFDYKGIQEIINYDKNIEEHDIEQLSAKLLFDLTRNTGFEVSKGVLGECWIKSCCEWDERQEDDICGLDYNRLSVFDKMKRIYVGSSLKLQIPKVGLEVMA